MYHQVAWGGLAESISAKDFQEVVRALASKPGGWAVAVEILSARFFPKKEGDQKYPPEVIDTGCEVLRQITLTKDQELDDYNLKVLTEGCLPGEKGSVIVWEICQTLRGAESKRDARAYNYPHLIEALFTVHPTTALDALCGDSVRECEVGVRIIDDVRRHSKNPLDLVAEDELISRCDEDPSTRYPAVASIVTISEKAEETSIRQWTKTALRVLERAPDRISVLKRYIGQFSPMLWNGSRASNIERYTKLLDDLNVYPDAAVIDFIAQEKVRIAHEFEVARQYDAITDREHDERFE